jgi:Cdc6-like AAA superfamily ATPase
MLKGLQKQHRPTESRPSVSCLILIYGRTGSGKSLFAKRIQSNAERQGYSNFLSEYPSRRSSNEQLKIIADAMTRLSKEQIEVGIVTVGSSDSQLRIVVESNNRTPFEVLDLISPKI